MNELIVRPTTDVARTVSAPGSAMPTPAEKAAIILSILEPTDAAELLKSFDPQVAVRIPG